MSVYKDLLLNYNVKSIKKNPKKPTILHEKINVIPFMKQLLCAVILTFCINMY